MFGTRSESVSEADTISLTEKMLAATGSSGTSDERQITYDDAGDGHRIYMGVSSAEDWDWEWGYADFGKVSSEYFGPAGEIDIKMRNDVKAEGWFLHVQYSPRIADRWEANLKLGVLRWDGSLFARLTKLNTGTGDQTSDLYETRSGIDEYFGAGLLYTVNERWKIRFDANRYMLADDKMDTFGIAAQFWFTGRLINNIFDY